MKKIREWVSIKTVKSPRLIVLLYVLVANLLFICGAAFTISRLTPPSPDYGGFGDSLFSTVMMYLGIGGIDMVIEDFSQAGLFLVLACVITIVIGMVVFMYALIGYMSEVISSFVTEADSSSRKLHISGHIIILNWNTRAAEIINELLYKNTKEKVVVLVGSEKDDIISDIDERLSDTVEEENEAVGEACAHMGFWARRLYLRKHRMRNRLTVIVREGDTCSTKQLNDISIKEAKSVILLSGDARGGDDGEQARFAGKENGNAQTIKTLVQVAEMTGSEDSANDQQLIVEVEDDRTMALVNTVIEHKMRRGKCNIVPVAVNRILGQVFSQFSIMPELNLVYRTLFSNRGAAFYVESDYGQPPSDTGFISAWLENHQESIPLTVKTDEVGVTHRYLMAGSEKDLQSAEAASWDRQTKLSINLDYETKERRILVLGHNSKSAEIMEGFVSYCGEWQKKDRADVLRITVVDDEENLAKQDDYQRFPCVKKVIAADLFDKDAICTAVSEHIGEDAEGAAILILSNDDVSDEDLDADALTYLILVQDIFNRRLAEDPGFDQRRVDMVVEILDPKNYDVVSNYSTHNIVISNRYISKMIMQIGEKEALFDFYIDILSYDGEDSEVFFSKEIYIKKASEFFREIPGLCTAASLIRAVFHAAPEDNKSVVLGFVRASGEMVLFEGNQSEIPVALTGEDKLILFSNH